LPIEEQLTSDDIQQVYANRLHFQQKVKWFYGLLTTSSLNRHIFPYNTNRGLRSKKLMGFSFLSELENRLDTQLHRLGWFPTIASSRQAIRHKHIGLWKVKDQTSQNLNEARNVALTQKLSEGDILFFQKKKTLTGRGTNLLVNHWLSAKASFNSFYRFPWRLLNKSHLNQTDRSSNFFSKFTSFSFINQSHETIPISFSFETPLTNQAENRKEQNSFRVWSLGGDQTSLHLSSSAVEKSIHSAKKTFNYGKLNGPSIVSSDVFLKNKDPMGIHLASSPLWNWSMPNHLEYHCQAFFALYKEHPVWMTTKIPDTKVRLQYFKSYMRSHI
jgi:hypothetical protein